MDDTTNNVMELEALRQAIIVATGFNPASYKKITICTDSAYALGAITQWSRGWVSRGWRTAEGKPVANKDLIEDIYNYWYFARKDKIEIIKVKAHATCRWNNVVDELAKGARDDVCGKCIYRHNDECTICQITRSPEWLAERVPSLKMLEKKRQVGSVLK